MWSEIFRGERAAYTVVLTLGVGLHAIDVFVISSILPTVVGDIGGEAYYAWSTMLYMVASILGTAGGGILKAAIGARRGYTLGGLIFLAGTALCGLSPSMPVLLAARVVQGLGGGLLLSQSLALVSELYPQELRTRILALISAIWGVAALIGPLIGGIFAEIGWWRGAFWSTTPIIAGFTLVAWLSLPGQAVPGKFPRFPIRRMSTLAIAVLAAGISGSAGDMLGSAGDNGGEPILAGGALLAVQGALLLLSLLLLLRTFRIDAASEKRLFPPRPLAIRTPVGAAYWIFLLFSVTHTALGMFLPLSLQVLHGVTALVAGYSVAAFALSWTAASFLTASWRGPSERRAILGGPLLTAVSLGLLTLTIDNGSVYVIYPLVIGSGLGIGAANLHLTSTTMRLAEPGYETLTASSIPTVRSLGISLGAALAGLVANAAGMDRGIDPETVRRAVLWVYSLATLCPAVAFLLALAFMRMTARRDAVTAAGAK
jgi:MFS family permease